tara:strand:- start:810 stop:1001 length:192 start_codon:yes stop_codon:yes gene_type:complete
MKPIFSIPVLVFSGLSYSNPGKAEESITDCNTVTSIGDRAFRDCNSLTSITIPDHAPPSVCCR